MAAKGFFNFLGGGRLTGVQELLFGSIRSSSAGLVGTLETAKRESCEGGGDITGLRAENAGADGLVGEIALNAGRPVVGKVGGRGGGGDAGVEVGIAFSSGHAFEGGAAAFP